MPRLPLPQGAFRVPLAMFLALCCLAGALGFDGSRAAAAGSLPLEKISLPPGFRIKLVARVDNAREMALGDNNVLFIGSMEAGKVYALELDGQMHARRLHVIASGLELPAGVAFRDGSLYVSAVRRILRYDHIERDLDHPPQPVVVRSDLPRETQHGPKFIAFGPDGWLYVPQGAPCNICDPDPRRYAAIFRMHPDGSGLERFASGIRNTVGFDWQPGTHELWFTHNGRDFLGDESPPDALERAGRPGLNYGFPYCHAGSIPDPQYGGKRACSEFTPPAEKLDPHVAPLGMRFYTGHQFPAEYRDQIFIAEHGSWNRSSKIGYRLTVVKVQGERAISYTPFATGWLQGQSAWGRPADVQVLPDGSLLVSDDSAGAIYRITYSRTR